VSKPRVVSSLHIIAGFFTTSPHFQQPSCRTLLNVSELFELKMNRSITRVFFAIFLTFSARHVSAETAAPYAPFIAIDEANGSFPQVIKDELNRTEIGHESLRSPITSEQLKGASVLLICAPFRNEMTSPSATETDHRLYSNEEIATILNFVQKGGVLIGSGQAWTWEPPAYGNKDRKDFPLNQIGEALGFSVSGCCDFDRYERKFLSIIKEPKVPVGAAFSNIDFKGSYDKLVRSSTGYCGGGAKRGNGRVYIFGHQAILKNIPEFASSVFLGLSPQKATNSGMVHKDTKESEIQEAQNANPASQTNPELPLSNINPLDLLAEEGANLIAWVTSPLDVDVPDEFRGGLLLLREDLLDHHSITKNSNSMYLEGAELCANLIVTFDKKEKEQIKAKLRIAQTKAQSELSNQALEARRNYKMSWPQYEREMRQREVLTDKRANEIDVKAQELKVKWIVTAGELRKSLDRKYAQFRDSIRKR